MVSASEARYTAEWTNGFLFFDEELLPDIIKELERSYNVKIHLEDNSLETFRFYGNFVSKRTDYPGNIRNVSFDWKTRIQDK